MQTQISLLFDKLFLIWAFKLGLILFNKLPCQWNLEYVDYILMQRVKIPPWKTCVLVVILNCSLWFGEFPFMDHIDLSENHPYLIGRYAKNPKKQQQKKKKTTNKSENI